MRLTRFDRQRVRLRSMQAMRPVSKTSRRFPTFSCSTFSTALLRLNSCAKPSAMTQPMRQIAEQQQWGDNWVETRLVVTCENGAALNPESVSRYWRQALKKSLLPKIRLHDLRHTHATLALQAGIHPRWSARDWVMPGVDHARHLLARHPDVAGRGSGADRRAGVRQHVVARSRLPRAEGACQGGSAGKRCDQGPPSTRRKNPWSPVSRTRRRRSGRLA